MINCIRVTPEGVYDELDVNLESYNDICLAIDSNGMEVVRTDILERVFSDHVRMIVDDCGAINGSKYNPFASKFYAGQIFGTVLFVREEGYDLYPLRNIGLVSCWFAGEFGLKHA